MQPHRRLGPHFTDFRISQLTSHMRWELRGLIGLSLSLGQESRQANKGSGPHEFATSNSRIWKAYEPQLCAGIKGVLLQWNVGSSSGVIVLFRRASQNKVDHRCVYSAAILFWILI